jgi:hypothetical protein
MKQLPKDDRHDEKQKLQRFAINCCSFKYVLPGRKNTRFEQLPFSQEHALDRIR